MKLFTLGKTVAMILLMTTAPVVAGTFSQPGGLAVDANGNLYVASQLTNQVFVFDKTLTPQPQLTISAGLSQPISLAIDTKGVLYVGNIGTTPQITAYNPNAFQTVARSFAAFRPYALAIGADNVLYSFDNATTLNVYNTTLVASTLQSYNVSAQFGKSTPGVAAMGSDNGLFYVWNANNLNYASEAQLFANKISVISGLGTVLGSASFAMTFDKFHNAFVTDLGTKSVGLLQANFAASYPLIGNLPAFPTGIALDKARNRLFVSLPSLNMVNVYTITYNANNIPSGATFVKTLR